MPIARMPTIDTCRSTFSRFGTRQEALRQERRRDDQQHERGEHAEALPAAVAREWRVVRPRAMRV